MNPKSGKKRNTPRKISAQKARREGGLRHKNPSTFDGGLKGFSMVDVARNTEHHSSWGSKQLRHGRIDFVSASALDMESTVFEAVIDDKSRLENEQMPSSTPSPDATEQRSKGADCNTIERDQEAFGNPEALTETDMDSKTPQNSNSNSRPEKPLFFVDTNGDETALSLGKIACRPLLVGSDGKHNDEDTDSSEEIVLFTGRRNGSAPPKPTASKNPNIQAIEEDIRSFSLRDDQMECHRNESSRLETREGSHNSFRKLKTARAEIDSQVKSAVNLAMEDYMENISHEQTPKSSDTTEGEEDHTNTREEDSYSEEQELIGDPDERSSQASVNSKGMSPDDSRLEKAQAAMTDESIARRLAKQEELGLGSNEILLWHEHDMAADMDGGDDIDSLRVAARDFGKGCGNQRRGTQASRFTPLIDTYNILDQENYSNFDVMDFGRSSLQRKTKSAKNNLPIQLSDSELEMNMLMAWENDRARKKRRKQKRAMAQEDSLFEGKENGIMIRKYPNGITNDEVKREILDFLDSDEVVLNLIPMDKRARRTVHELANRLSLRSKSKGSGLERYPCLFKTSQTAGLNNTSVDSILMQFNLRRSSRRLGLQPKDNFKRQSGISGQSRRAGGGSSTGVTYRDGETVGGSAPAIGSENKGHALLSKMGWTSGTALGALNNKGSLEPVTQVVKVTKAGLG